MTQPRQKLSAFFRNQRTFRVIDGFLLLLPWVLGIVLFKNKAVFSVPSAILLSSLLVANKPSINARYAFSAALLSFVFGVFIAGPLTVICWGILALLFDFNESTVSFEDTPLDNGDWLCDSASSLPQALSNPSSNFYEEDGGVVLPLYRNREY